RRQRNRIEMLKDPDGNWVNDKESIIAQYMSITRIPTGLKVREAMHRVLQQIPPKATTQMNRELLQQPSMEEVRKAAFNMGSQKCTMTRWNITYLLSKILEYYKE
ncbi:unnamed protein product, partial [Ilex paraguariensis]